MPYPDEFDDFTTNHWPLEPKAGHAEEHNKIGLALEHIEAELGLNPSAAFATVAARLLAAEARLSALEATPSFGTLLPARISAGSGSTFYISQAGNDTTGDGSLGSPWKTPSKAFATVPLGSTIRARDTGGTFVLTGDQTWNRVGTAGTVTTLESAPGERAVFSGGRINVNGGKYLRLRNFDKISAEAAVQDNIKIQNAAQFIDIDGLLIQDADRQGILVVDATTGNWQVWNTKLYSNGHTADLDHGMYVAATDGVSPCIIANCLFDDNYAFGLQLYPNANKVWVLTSTFDGHTGHGSPGAAGIGGITISNETPSSTSDDNKVIGCLMSNGSVAVWQYVPINPVTVSVVQDCMGYNNATATEFATGNNIVYSRVIQDTNPLYVNRASHDFHLQDGSPAIDAIDSVNYGYIPATDMEGAVRSVATMGCYAKA